MKYFIHLPMKMEPTMSSETSAIRIQTPGNYPKRNKLHLEHGESLKTRMCILVCHFEQVKQCAYHIAVRHVRAITLAVGQQYVLHMWCVRICSLRYPACNVHAP